MIAGQTNDMFGGADAGPGPDPTDSQRPPMFEAAGRLGAICGGEHAWALLADYGRHLGRAFQIADDAGRDRDRPVGKPWRDAGTGKQTYPAAVSVPPAGPLGNRLIGVRAL